MAYLITGISGFVGGHYLEYIFGKNSKTRVFGVDVRNPKVGFLKSAHKKNFKFYKGSLLNKQWTRRLIEKIRPDYIVNLAAYSSVAYSWKNPAECYANNTGIFLNIAEGVRKAKIKTKILSVGSSEEYGSHGKKAGSLLESFSLDPTNPYAIARTAQEHFSKIYAGLCRISIIRTRSFNHIGPRQSDTFVIGSLAKQVIEAKKRLRSEIVCGDLSLVRDFTDVRDVARAYDLLLRKGNSGEVYNVCSGQGHRLSEILRMLRKKAGVNAVPIKRDPKLVRPRDSKVIVGSCKKLKRDTGFKQKYTLSRSLDDILAYWESRIAN